MWWIFLAVLSAIFAGLTAVLSKAGLKDMDSDLATALRTAVVFLFSWLMAWIAGSLPTLGNMGMQNLLFLILSGCATGGSWICYFRALQLGDINKVVPVDKSSTALTVFLSCIFLQEDLTLLKIISICLLLLGTYWMIEHKNIPSQKEENTKWFFYAALSAILASLTSILAKIGIEGVESNLATAVRTSVVLIMAWIIVFRKRKKLSLSSISQKNWIFLILSGMATGLSWLCYYRSLQEGRVSIVVSIDKLSIGVTMLFSWLWFKEKFSLKSIAGLSCIFLATLLLLF